MQIIDKVGVVEKTEAGPHLKAWPHQRNNTEYTLHSTTYKCLFQDMPTIFIEIDSYLTDTEPNSWHVFETQCRLGLCEILFV